MIEVVLTIRWEADTAAEALKLTGQLLAKAETCPEYAGCFDITATEDFNG